ncbi:MAG: hypothetical protein ACE5EM_10315 [Sphingomonadales bacterium]
MSSSSFPTNSSTVLVADASVVINLNATGYATEIIQSHPGLLAVTDNAFAELARGIGNGHSDADQLQALSDSGIVNLVQLSDTGKAIYASLIEGSALRTLDDGEAATIGYAHEVGGIALIDERKAINLCANNFPDLAVASTVDLLTHEAVGNALGKQSQIEAIVRALQIARMRVPPDHVNLVVDMIGEEVASTCNSLPKSVRAKPGPRNGRAKKLQTQEV